MLIVKTVALTLFQQNVRLLIDSESGKGVLVDPGGDFEQIVQLIDATDCEIDQIFVTHSHIDHVGGVSDCLDYLQQKQGVRPTLLGSEIEREFRGFISQQAMMFGVSSDEYKNCPEPDRYINEGDLFWVGGYAFELLFTPGHAPGHFSAFCQSCDVEIRWYEAGRFARESASRSFKAPVVIAGDALFSGSIGRTDLPGGNYEILIKSIKEKLLTLPDETIVLSGHGPDTTIGVERRANPFLA